MINVNVSTKQDRSQIRTIDQLLRRYGSDLEAIASIQRATENNTFGLNKTNATLEHFVVATLGSLENMQSQIDGNISTWFYSGKPTMANVPASEWFTTEEKDAHLGDLYYDRDTGYGYRFSVTDSVYNWIKLTDNDVVQALAIANAAQDTADGKRRVFTDTPSPPYDVGDLWFKSKEIYICNVAKPEGDKYESDDFGIATKYTDDTRADEVADDLSKNYSTTVAMNSAISKSASEILLTVAGTYTTKNELTNEISILEEQYAAVSLKASGLETTVSSHTTQINSLDTRVDSAVSNYTQLSDKFNWVVKSGTSASDFLITDRMAKLTAEYINLNGLVMFSGLDASTQSTINTAQSTADAASANASSALSTATTANTNATSALNRASYHYGTCATAAATVAKVVTLSGFSLYTGAMVSVYFTYANTASSPTLNVNSTGAKSIRVNNAAITSKYFWRAKDTVTFIYNGTYWVIADTSANSLLASWCSDNDVTLIDGGKIYAKSVKAESIDVENLFAQDITATGKIRGMQFIGATFNGGRIEMMSEDALEDPAIIIRSDNSNTYLANFSSELLHMYHFDSYMGAELDRCLRASTSEIKMGTLNYPNFNLAGGVRLFHKDPLTFINSGLSLYAEGSEYAGIMAYTFSSQLAQDPQIVVTTNSRSALAYYEARRIYATDDFTISTTNGLNVTGGALTASAVKTAAGVDLDELNSKLVHHRRAGTYTYANNSLYGVCGFISGSAKYAYLYIPMIVNVEITSFVCTSITCSIRTVGGTYLGGAQNIDLSSYIYSTNMQRAQGQLCVILYNSDGWGITNNTPLCGACGMTFTLS